MTPPTGTPAVLDVPALWHLITNGHASRLIDVRGIAAWQADQAPVTTGTPRWDLERQVRLAAFSIVVLAVLVSTLVEPVKRRAVFIGAGLTFAALANTRVMAKLPDSRGPRTDQVVAALTGDRRYPMSRYRRIRFRPARAGRPGRDES